MGRSGVFVIMMLFGGLFFTAVAVVAWQTRRRVTSVVLAVLAGVDLALAIQIMIQYAGK